MMPDMMPDRQMGDQSGPPGIQPPNARTSRTVIIHGAKAEWCRGNWRLVDENDGGRTEVGLKSLAMMTDLALDEGMLQNSRPACQKSGPTIARKRPKLWLTSFRQAVGMVGRVRPWRAGVPQGQRGDGKGFLSRILLRQGHGATGSPQR